MPDAALPPITWSGTRRALIADWRANSRSPKVLVLLTGFRLCQLAMGDLRKPRPVAYPLIFAYRFFTEWILGIELRPKTPVGPGLSIFHGVGLVVNDHTVIGAGVHLRNGVTIGHRKPGGPCPVLRDGVEVGANAVILGGIELGAGSKVGAGAVVLHSVAAGGSVAGNPAQPVGASARRAADSPADQ